jgi:hypothetical protein
LIDIIVASKSVKKADKEDYTGLKETLGDIVATRIVNITEATAEAETALDLVANKKPPVKGGKKPEAEAEQTITVIEKTPEELKAEAEAKKAEAKKKLKFPIIAKSLNSFQSRGVEKINNAKELDALSDEYDLFQEQIKISHEYRFLFFRGYKTDVTLIAAFHRDPVNDKAKGLREAMTFDSMKDKEASEFSWMQVTIFEFNQKQLFDIAAAVFKHNPGLNVVGIDIAYQDGDMERPYYIEQNITPSMIANVPFLVYKFIYEDAYHKMSPYTIQRLSQLSLGYMIKRFKEDDLFNVDSPNSGTEFRGLSYSEMLNSKPA